MKHSHQITKGRSNPKRPLKHGRVLPVLCAFLGFCASQAQAGQWQLHYHITKMDIHDGLGRENVLEEAFDTPSLRSEWLEWDAGSFADNYYPPEEWSDAMAKYELSVQPVFTWVPNGTLASDPMPAELRTREFGEALACLWGSVASPDAFTTANNGLGDPANLINETEKRSAQAGYTPQYQPIWHLKTLTTGGTQAPLNAQGHPYVEGPVRELLAQGFHPAALNGFTLVFVALQYQAATDTRSVKLSRGITPKQENDPTLDKSGDEWVGSDSTGHGHTTYSYLTVDPLDFIIPFKNMPIPSGQTNAVPNSQTFTVTDSNFVSPSYSWDTGQLTRNDLGQTPVPTNPISANVPNGTKVKVLNGISDFWVGPATGQKTYTVTCDVTDADGITARAKYNLTAHDQYENFRADSANPSDLMEYRFPSTPSSTSLWSHPLADDDYNENVTGTSTWVSTYTGSVELSGSIGGSANAGVIVASAGVDCSAGVAVGISIGQEFGIEAPTHGDRMRYAMLIGTYERKNYLYDEFAPSGKVKNSARPDGAWEFWFDDPTTLSPPRRSWSREYLFGDWDANGFRDGEE